jgi:hypothetical protein
MLSYNEDFAANETLSYKDFFAIKKSQGQTEFCDIQILKRSFASTHTAELFKYIAKSSKCNAI